MSRKLRIEYPGAMYHVMNRGDQREDIFRDDQDRQKFLSTLGEACAEDRVAGACVLPDAQSFPSGAGDAPTQPGVRDEVAAGRLHQALQHPAQAVRASLRGALQSPGGGGQRQWLPAHGVRLRSSQPGAGQTAPARGGLGELSAGAAIANTSSPPGQRPGWLRVDRLLGEKGIPEDSRSWARSSLPR